MYRVESFVLAHGLSRAARAPGPRAQELPSGLSSSAACGISVPEPVTPALEGGVLTTGPPGKSLTQPSLRCSSVSVCACACACVCACVLRMAKQEDRSLAPQTLFKLCCGTNLTGERVWAFTFFSHKFIIHVLVPEQRKKKTQQEKSINEMNGR